MFADDKLHGAHRNFGGPGLCRQPQAAADLQPSGGQHEFRAQYPVLRFPPRPMLSERPGDSSMGTAAPHQTLRQMHLPGWIRRVIPSLIERRSPVHGPLTGQNYGGPLGDPEGRGVDIRGVHPHGVGPRNATDQLVDGFEKDGGPSVPVHGETFENHAPDILDHVQSAHSEEHVALRSARASFPGLQIVPVPQTRAAIVTAKNLPVEIPLPSGTVFFYISWSGRGAGNDLIVSMIGGLGNVGAATGAGDNFDTHDGLFINPAEGQRFYAKGKQAITVMVPNSSGLVAPFFVSIECYLNN